MQVGRPQGLYSRWAGAKKSLFWPISHDPKFRVAYLPTKGRTYALIETLGKRLKRMALAGSCAESKPFGRLFSHLSVSNHFFYFETTFLSLLFPFSPYVPLKPLFCPLYLLSFWNPLSLVACTRLYTPLCPSVGRSVGRSVTLLSFLSILFL